MHHASCIMYIIYLVKISNDIALICFPGIGLGKLVVYWFHLATLSGGQ